MGLLNQNLANMSHADLYRARSPASMDEVKQGYLGLFEGLTK